MINYNLQTKSYGYVTGEYPAKCVRVVDGDTLELSIDQGLRSTQREHVRLVGCNADELHSKNLAERASAVIARDFLAAMVDLPGEWPLKISTLKTKSFDRWLATVFFTDAKGIERNVSVEMVSSGHAKLFTEE